MSRDAHDEFLSLACLSYEHSDHPSRRAKARELLAEDPALARASPHAAAATGDAEALAAFLAADESRAGVPGGPQAWPPLLFACYARLETPGERSGTLQCARLLLDQGADPDSHFLWGGDYRFTALTGAFGEGEAGPVNQPRHAAWRALAELLLERGADPNDAQGLYDRMFRPGAECLALLLHHGLDAEARNNWFVRDRWGRRRPHPEGTLSYQLQWAAAHDHLDRVELLHARGFDLAARDHSGVTPWRTAAREGAVRVRRFLESVGAGPGRLPPKEALRGALLGGDRGAVDAAGPKAVRRVLAANRRLLHEAAGRGWTAAAALLIDAGAAVGGSQRNTPLHEAAWNGHRETAALLVERGAPLDARDREHGATPLGWARHAGEAELAAWLESLGAPG